MGIVMIAVLDTFTHTEAIRIMYIVKMAGAEGRYPDIFIHNRTGHKTHDTSLQRTNTQTAILLIRYQRKVKKYPAQVSTSRSIGYTRILADSRAHYCTFYKQPGIHSVDRIKT